MVKTGNVEWDLFVGVPATALVLWEEGVLGEIDYSQIDPDVLAQLPDAAKKPYGVAGIYVSEVVAFNTDAFPAGGPQPNSWKDLWDVETFPGKRMLPAGDYSVNPIEVALLADDVKASDLYPLDLDRAYSKLDEIRPHVVKWVSSSSAVPQALVDGEVAVGYAAAARVAELKEQGAPIDFTYNNAMYFLDYWVSPKGAPNYENAMKFLEFASRAEPQAEMAKLMPYGPSNPKAFDLMSDADRKRLSSSPENMETQIEINSEWWAAEAESGRSNHAENARRWNAWITQ
jgi:putative spermidine/putrescine transport system substrate-binding protein